jgi:hypothetical protein
VWPFLAFPGGGFIGEYLLALIFFPLKHGNCLSNFDYAGVTSSILQALVLMLPVTMWFALWFRGFWMGKTG